MVYTQFIDGALTPASNRESWINYNPANNNQLGEVCQANEQDIEADPENQLEGQRRVKQRLADEKSADRQ